MTNPKGEPGTGWSVVDQVPEYKVGPGSVAQEGVTVHFTTQYGASNSVWLPRVSYDENTVRQAITELAATMDRVHTLTG